MSRVSVLLPYRNAAPTIREALVSVLDDLAQDDEVLAIDDGSTDDGPRVVASIEDERLIPIATGGVRISKALAIGLERARGDFIARMDGDDLSHRGRFAKGRALLESDASLGVVATRIALEGGDAGLARYVAWQNSLVRNADHARGIYIESPLCHPSVMLRRSALEAVGGWHDPPWPEDWDLWLRLHHAGFGIAKVPEVLFTWRRVPGNLTTTDPRYSMEKLLELRAHYLARFLGARRYAVWGAGQTGKHLARALEPYGLHASFFIDIDPKKIGRTARNVTIEDPEAGLARARSEKTLVLIAVGAEGARDLVRAHMSERHFIEGEDYVCGA